MRRLLFAFLLHGGTTVSKVLVAAVADYGGGINWN